MHFSDTTNAANKCTIAGLMPRLLSVAMDEMMALLVYANSRHALPEPFKIDFAHEEQTTIIAVSDLRPTENASTRQMC